MNGLTVEGIGLARGGKTILAGASFTAPHAQVTGLVGPNGAGKSSLLTALLGLVPARGRATFDGEDLRTMPRRERARLAAYVEQSASTEERLSVRDVVALGRIPFETDWASGPSAQDDAIVAAAMADTGMSDFADRRFNTLSGGEQQRVQVARALAQQPRLLLLDEPTSHLDIAAQLHLLSLLRRRAAAGATILIVLHDLNLAARFCDRLVILQAGRTLAEGAPHEVLTPARILQTWGVAANLLHDPASGRPVIVYNEAPAEKSLSNPD